MKQLAAIMGLFCYSASVLAFDSSLAFSVQPELYRYNDDSYVYKASAALDKPKAVSQQLLELSLGSDELAFIGSAKHRLSAENSTIEFSVKELVYSRSIADWELSVGRRINSWGVGLAYRPLDLMQREDLIRSDQESLKGVNQVGLEHYGERSSFALYVVNSGENDKASVVKQAALIARYTETGESIDWQALLRYSDQQAMQLGGGFSTVLTDALELHASALYSARSQKRHNDFSGHDDRPLANTNQSPNVEHKDGVNWMLGGNYSWSNKHNVIAEYWHDDSALIQSNLYLRYQYQASNLTPEFGVLVSPADSGFMATAKLSYNKYQVKYNIGVKAFQGGTDSVYGQMPKSGELYLTAFGNF